MHYTRFLFLKDSLLTVDTKPLEFRHLDIEHLDIGRNIGRLTLIVFDLKHCLIIKTRDILLFTRD
jgi:hypothetical protein